MNGLEASTTTTGDSTYLNDIYKLVRAHTISLGANAVVTLKLQVINNTSVSAISDYHRNRGRIRGGGYRPFDLELRSMLLVTGDAVLVDYGDTTTDESFQMSVENGDKLSPMINNE